jgi:hypothetical protein
MSERIFPPRLKDWKPGTRQLGVFLRTAKGSRIEILLGRCPKEVSDQIMALAVEATQRAKDKKTKGKKSKKKDATPEKSRNGAEIS